MKKISTVSSSKRGLAAIGLSFSLLSAATSSFAGVTTFAGGPGQLLTAADAETAFQSALGTFTTYDFDSFVFDGSTGGIPSVVLDQQISGIDFDNAVVVTGAYGGSFESPPQVVLNEDFGGPLDDSPIVFTFDNPVLGVGLFNTSTVDAELFNVYDVNDVLIDSLFLPSFHVNFGGFISTTPIAKVRVFPTSPTNGSIFIDTLTVGAAAIPEPSVLLGFLTAGSLGLLLLRRRR